MNEFLGYLIGEVGFGRMTAHTAKQRLAYKLSETRTSTPTGNWFEAERLLRAYCIGRDIDMRF